VRADRKFLVHSGIAVGAVTGLSAFPLAAFGSGDIVVAVVVGCFLSILNALAGSFMLEYAFDKPSSTFLKAVIGGMGIRMAVLLALFYVLIRLVGVHTIALTISLFGFYIIFLVLEVLSIQRKVEIRNQLPIHS
jgi:hypothetical protein